MTCFFIVLILKTSSSAHKYLRTRSRQVDKVKYNSVDWYFQHAHFIPIVGVGKRGAYSLVHGDLPRQYSFGTTLRLTGPVPADSRQ